jgi:hypothetical protein
MLQRIALTGLLLFCLSSLSPAQQLLFGARLGTALSNFRVSEDPFKRYQNVTPQLGLSLGLAFHVSVDDLIGLDVEAYYINRNVSVYSSDRIIDPQTKRTTFLESDGTYRLTGIDIPILLSLYLRPEKKLRPKIYVGPSLNWLASAQYDGQSVYTRNDTSTVYLINDNIKKDYVGFFPSLVMGGGINYQVNSHLWVTGDLRYNLGVANLIDTENKRTPAANIKSGDFLFLLGFAYKLYDY